MAIKIVTDSTADLPPRLAEDMGITVVPAYVNFGEEKYRDRVDISEDEFYQRLMQDPIHPTTEPPTPQDFAGAYRKLSRDADGILSIHISSKLSATCNSALMGKKMAETECPIEVVDSQLVTMALGLLVIAASTMARSTNNLAQLVADEKQIIPGIRLFGMFDTLKYLALGGRIGKAKALIGSVLAVKPILTMNDGEIEPADQVRSRTKGIKKLLDFVKRTPDIQDLAIVYSTTPEEARALAGHMGSTLAIDNIRSARLGPALGVHGGPGILFVALRGRV